MSVLTNRWRDRATLVIGFYLVSTPWIFDGAADNPSSGNAWLAGMSLILVTLWALLEAGPRAGELIRIGIAGGSKATAMADSERPQRS